jgi:peptidoglycan/xylan/chitin deacetylase (PgdA/CDA1 family)
MRSPLVALAATATLTFLAACAASDGAVDDGPDYDMEGDTSEEALGSPGIGVPSSLHLDKRHRIFLTFDDGPNPTTTPRVLDTLKAHGIHAAFFITGVNIRGNEALIRRMHAEGHVIASHQWRHVVRAPIDQFRTWAPLERDTLDQVVGTRLPRFFRYPGGAGSTAREDILRANGYVDGGIGWDIDSLDWCFKNGSCTRPEVPVAQQRDFLTFLYTQTDRRNGGVILFHDIWPNTAARLDTILDHFESEGYAFGELPTQGR